MSLVTRHALRVYSSLTELRGKEADVLDALIPFFEPILELMNGKVFDPQLLAQGVRKLYNWKFTKDIAEHFQPRLAKQGYIVRQAAHNGSAVFTVVYAGQRSAIESNIVNVFERIIDEFANFPPKVTDLLSYNKSREELKDILIRFLVTMDSVNESSMSQQLGFFYPSGDPLQILDKLEEGGRPLGLHDRYICASFVQHLIRKRREYIPHLSRLASIALLTEVVDEFLKPTSQERATDLTIALDAPLALDYIGCSGTALKDDIRLIVGALKAIGCKFIVFDVSCREMQRNLNSFLSNQPNKRHGVTQAAIVRGETNLDFVRAVANHPEQAINQAGLSIKQMSLTNFPSLEKYFTRDQYEDLFSSIFWVADVMPR